MTSQHDAWYLIDLSMIAPSRDSYQEDADISGKVFAD